jgi:hypothetical protein
MRAAIIAVAVFCASAPLFSQATSKVGQAYLDDKGNQIFNSSDEEYLILYQFLVGPGGVKTLDYTVCNADAPAIKYSEGELLVRAASGASAPVCTPISEKKAESLNFVQQAIAALKTWAADANAPYKVNYGAINYGDGPDAIHYGALAERNRSLLATVAPAAPPDPFMVLVDGLSGNVMKFDLTTGAVVNQVLPPPLAVGPVGLRLSAAGSTNEVWVPWVTNETPQITVVDVGAQTVLANIATPSIPPNNFVPVGVVFTNSGDTAFEAVSYYSPDSSGNNGALVILDAVNRVVKSTFPLKYAPGVVLMAPDALTIYLLSSAGELTYYDVLSGTADLSVSTYTPGFNNGYGVGNAFVHPDGTRLFWNVGTNLEVFDLTTRLVTSQFPSGLPNGSGVTLEVSQDGSTAVMGNGQGTVVALDTQFGLILATSQNSTATLAFPGN